MEASAEVFLKASMEKQRLQKYLSPSKVISWKLKSQLEALDTIIEDQLNIYNIESPQPTQKDVNIQDGILVKAKKILSRNRQKRTNILDQLYQKLKVETQNDNEDVYNHLIMNSIENSDKPQSSTPIVKQASIKPLKLKTDPIYKDYQALPKQVVNRTLKRKQETLKSLNQALKQEKLITQGEVKSSLQNIRLPSIFTDITLKELQNKETLQKYIIKGEFYIGNKYPKTTRPPSILSSFRQLNRQLMKTMDYQNKINKIERQSLRNSIVQLQEFAGTEFDKLTLKNEYS